MNLFKRKTVQWPKRKGPVDARHVERNLRVLKKFVAVYCRKHHDGESPCAECRQLIDYARGRLERCPYDPKPKCKACPTHCYQKQYRNRIKEIMRFSGTYFIKRGRLDWLVKYFLMD